MGTTLGCLAFKDVLKGVLLHHYLCIGQTDKEVLERLCPFHIGVPGHHVIKIQITQFAIHRYILGLNQGAAARNITKAGDFLTAEEEFHHGIPCAVTFNVVACRFNNHGYGYLFTLSIGAFLTTGNAIVTEDADHPAGDIEAGTGRFVIAAKEQGIIIGHVLGSESELDGGTVGFDGRAGKRGMV